MEGAVRIGGQPILLLDGRADLINRSSVFEEMRYYEQII